MNNDHELTTLFWETTLRCNARCAFCGSGCGDVRSYPDELTGDEIRAALLDISRKLDPSRIMLNVTGGEPLVREDVLDVAGYAAELGFPWGMVTNGSLIDDRVIDKMKASGMKTLTVSIDGCKETHERLRRLDGSFGRIISSLKSIRRQGFTEHLQVTTVVNKQNISELEELRRILLDIGLDSWRVVTADPIGRAKNNSAVLLDKDGMRRYFEFAEKYSDDRVLPVIQSCSHYFGEWEHRLRTRCFSCGAGKRVASILYNGDIFVCPNVERRKELIQGNVRTHSLADLWRSGFDFFRKRERTLADKCLTCYYRDSCLGDSLHTWDFDERRPRFCIKDYYGENELSAYREKAEGFDKELDRLRADCESPALLRISSDAPGSCRVFFERRAAGELFSYFDWGATTAANDNEQMACLLGRCAGGLIIVGRVVPVPLDLADRESAVFTSRTLSAAFAAANENGMELVGFVHSHPHELDTVLSTGDEALHNTLLRKYRIRLSMLVNPQKRRLRAYCNDDLSLAEIYIAGSRAELDGLLPQTQ